MKASVKKLEGKKWTIIPLNELIGKSIAFYISKSEQPCIAALLNEKDEPQFFLTNDVEQYEKYKQRAFTLMVDDLILLLGSETIPNHPVTQAVLEAFPDGKFQVLEDARVEGSKKQWW